MPHHYVSYLAHIGKYLLTKHLKLRILGYMVKKGNRRADMRVGVKDIAAASGRGYRTCIKDERRGRYAFGDLVSIAEYIVFERSSVYEE